MGLISSIAKIGAKAFNYGKRVLNCAPEFVLGESAEVIGKAYRSAPKGSIFTKAKTAAKAFESHVGALKATQGGFFKRLWTSTKNLIPDLCKAGKLGKQAAKAAGKSGFWGGLKSIGSTIAKKMPYIGALITICFELPSIIEGYKRGGIKGALEQCAGAGVELGCMAAGAAIGSCIAPGIGSAIGGLIGGLVGWGVRALTFPEPSDEETPQETEGTEGTEDADTQQTTTTTSPTTSTTTTNPSTSTTTTTPTPSTTTDQSAPVTTSGSDSSTSLTNPFGMGINYGMGMTNPFGMGINYGMGTNPFGYGIGFTSPYMFGDFNNPLGNMFMPGENIFQKYPSNYKFQYTFQ